MDLVVLVFEGGFSRISTTTDLASAIRKWRQRYGVFLPAVAFQMPATESDGCRKWSGSGRIPTTVAAERYGRSPIDKQLQRIVFLQYRSLGARAVPLLLEWRRAVDSAVKEVGGRSGLQR